MKIGLAGLAAVLRLLLAVAAISLTSLASQAQIVLVPTNAVWKYLDTGTDQGIDWRAPGFVDSAWFEGPAELGFGDGVEGRPEATLLDPGPPSPNHHITYYFRRRFNITGAESVTNLLAQVMRDDGAVVYLNGLEAGRTGMNPGPVDFSTPAAQPGVSGAEEFAFIPMNIDPGLLVEGQNVLAVEVHQLSGASSDVSFALALLVVTNAPPPSDKGQTLIVPPSIASVTAGYGAGTLSGRNLRVQDVYGSVNFPPNGIFWITELCYRPDLVFGFAFNTTVSKIQINLSTTQKSPGALSTAYDQNVGQDNTLVYEGALPVSSQFTGPPGGPRDFDIRIPLQEPFLYEPSAGHLLVDIQNISGSGASGLGGSHDLNDNASRVAGSLSSVTGGADSGVDALQIVYTTNPPPRPPRPLLLVRGPYLQMGTPTNVLVCWRTDRPTNSIARFGLAAGTLDWEARSEKLTNNHCLELTNLAPNTKYFYSVGANDTNIARGPDFYFVTAPTSAKPTRIWALGDCGTASDPNQMGAFKVRDAYLSYTGSRETDVWLMLGDNAYGSGTDSEYQSAVFNVYQAGLRRWPLWSTVGNHETYAPLIGQTVAYWDIFHLPTQGEAGGIPSGNERYYSFNYGNIHFVCLDSETAFTNSTGGADMLRWLEVDLIENTSEWIIAFWHSPPYTKGSHNSDSFSDSEGRMFWMRERVNPILESYGVDLVLCGHSHNYERSFPLDGHYGVSDTLQPFMIKDSGNGRPEDDGPYIKRQSIPEGNQGTIYVVAGSSGWATFVQPLPHPATFSRLLQLGSMVVDVDGSRMDAKFLRETGAVDDWFTIMKSHEPGPFVVTKFQIIGGRVFARLLTTAGKTYRVLRTPGLETPSWTPVSGDIKATGPVTSWSGPVEVGAEKAFYRAVQID